MSRAAPVEIDFLGLEKGGASTGLRPQPSSLRGIQDAMSKLDPSLLRTVLNSGAASAMDKACFKRFPSPRPVMGPASGPAVGRPPAAAVAAAPLTIFYNGTVAVFDLPPHKAEAIIKWAETTNASVRPAGRAAEALPGDHGQNQRQQQQQRPGLMLDKHADIPLARRKSLQRFLEKRKERVTAVLPCLGSTSSSSCDWAGDSGADESAKTKKKLRTVE